MSAAFPPSGHLQGPPAGARVAAWRVRGLAFVLWALAALCAIFWGLRLGTGRALPAGAAPVVRLPDPADPGSVARLLGGQALTEVAPAESGRLVLQGVVSGASGAGAALISVDGEPGRPFRAGSPVRPGLWLQSLQAREARLGPEPRGAATVVLELPPQEEAIGLSRP